MMTWMTRKRLFLPTVGSLLLDTNVAILSMKYNSAVPFQTALGLFPTTGLSQTDHGANFLEDEESALKQLLTR
jgi:hypothetical protein